MKRAVLVVEDEALIRLVAVDALEEEGFTVFEAGSVLEAIAILSNHPEIDVVFSDVNLPGGPSGLDLARLIGLRYPGVAVLVTSGRCRIPAGELPVGARFIAKPYRLEELAAGIKALMPERRNEASSGLR